MPRNTSGTYSATAGVPVTAGTTISTTMFNGLVADVSGELSDSLSRSAKGPMLAPLRNVDGTAAAPAVSFTSEPASGVYRAGATDVRLAVGGVDALKLTSGGVVGPINMPATAGVFATGASTTLTLRGNLSETNLNGDVAVTSSVTRTAGQLLDVQNNGLGKFQVDYQGLARLVNQAAAIQPASVWTAITPNANWTAGGGLAYWKTATGEVRLMGAVTAAVGATNPPFPALPAGFRPTSARTFTSYDSANHAVMIVTVNTDGSVVLSTVAGSTVPVVNEVTSLDPVHFLAQQ